MDSCPSDGHVQDTAAPNGWKIEIGPFAGGKDVPAW